MTTPTITPSDTAEAIPPAEALRVPGYVPTILDLLTPPELLLWDELVERFGDPLTPAEYVARAVVPMPRTAADDAQMVDLPSPSALA